MREQQLTRSIGGMAHATLQQRGGRSEKDHVIIEATLEALLELADALSEEEKRAVKEGLSEESLALFDLLLKPDLSKQEIDRIKKVAERLYNTLSAELRPHPRLRSQAGNKG